MRRAERRRPARRRRVDVPGPRRRRLRAPLARRRRAPSSATPPSASTSHWTTTSRVALHEACERGPVVLAASHTGELGARGVRRRAEPCRAGTPARRGGEAPVGRGFSCILHGSPRSLRPGPHPARGRVRGGTEAPRRGRRDRDAHRPGPGPHAPRRGRAVSRDAGAGRSRARRSWRGRPAQRSSSSRPRAPAAPSASTCSRSSRPTRAANRRQMRGSRTRHAKRHACSMRSSTQSLRRGSGCTAAGAHRVRHVSHVAHRLSCPPFPANQG